MSSILSHSADDTRRVGAALATALLAASSDHAVVIALSGELGAGKTTLIGGLLSAMGVRGAVRSPTYTLLEPYELETRTVYHLDLYRLADAKELEMLAPRDLLHPGAVLLVEWAERAAAALPRADLQLRLGYHALDSAAAERSIEVSAASTLGKQLAASLHAQIDDPGLSS